MCSSEAPAVQLQEHAAAILKDDALLGIQRRDPVLLRLAKGTGNSVTRMCSIKFLC